MLPALPRDYSPCTPPTQSNEWAIIYSSIAVKLCLPVTSFAKKSAAQMPPPSVGRRCRRRPGRPRGHLWFEGARRFLTRAFDRGGHWSEKVVGLKIRILDTRKAPGPGDPGSVPFLYSQTLFPKCLGEILSISKVPGWKLKRMRLHTKV